MNCNTLIAFIKRELGHYMRNRPKKEPITETIDYKAPTDEDAYEPAGGNCMLCDDPCGAEDEFCKTCMEGHRVFEGNMAELVK